jgi:hypothetical protein
MRTVSSLRLFEETRTGCSLISNFLKNQNQGEGKIKKADTNPTMI